MTSATLINDNPMSKSQTSPDRHSPDSDTHTGVAPHPAHHSETRSEATARLFACMDDADPTKHAQIEEELIRTNMTMAADASRRFRNRGIDTEDLEQVAYVGLVKAVQ